MAEIPETQQEPVADSHGVEENLKRALLKRVAIAGGLVVTLLSGLAVFDTLYRSPEPEAAIETAALPPGDVQATTTEPESQPEGKEVEPELKEEEVLAEAETKVESAAEPERTSAPTGTIPHARPERPLTRPAYARPAVIRPSEPVATIRKPDPAREIAKHAPPSRPLTRAAESLPRQFVVQMGVFNNVANAEELRTKLEAAGIPARIEARVQVGPFVTRQEAEQAREKLRGLGMESGLLVATRK